MYTFTTEQLRQLLMDTITCFAECDGVYDFSHIAQADTVEAMLANLEPAPAWQEIPFDGSPVTYESDDNISPAALGLQVEF